jgi:hypothetical protein
VTAAFGGTADDLRAGAIGFRAAAKTKHICLVVRPRKAVIVNDMMQRGYPYRKMLGFTAPTSRPLLARELALSYAFVFLVRSRALAGHDA